MFKKNAFFVSIFFVAITCLTFSISQAKTTISKDALGEFQNSYQRFGAPSTWKSSDERDKHHLSLYQKATDPNSSILKRYTYCIMLGLNEADPSTRPLAIKALDQLLDDKNVTPEDQVVIREIKNIMIFNQQNDPRQSGKICKFECK